MPPTSPFSKTHLVGIDEGHSKEGSITGLRLPDGRILLNFEQGTHVSIINEIARILKADVVMVKGTWTFTPAREEDENNE